MLNIKNYTSTVPAERSIMLIETKLISIGARHISKLYDMEGNVEGFTFQIVKDGIPGLIFKLPVKWQSVEKVLTGNIKKPRKHTLFLVKQQSLRTAWKLLYDWVCIQVTMIQLEQAEVIEIFLPYAYDSKEDKTFFEIIKNDNMKLLTEGSKKN